ncbi:MAG: ASCH domain-containing protein [Bradymonadaceae bacterium]
MPRWISFAETTEAVREQVKTVTRRDGWTFLESGTYLKPAVKCMGLDKGESVEPIFDDGTIIQVTDVWREKLNHIASLDEKCPTCQTTYNMECIREGFPEITGRQFAEYFMDAMGVGWDDLVTRIEFEYVGPDEHEFDPDEILP